MNNNKEIITNKKHHVLLTTSQKKLLEEMRLTSKETLAEVFERILNEKDELTKIVEAKFKKTAIKEYNEEAEKYLNRIIELNLSIEKKAQDLIDLEIKKYLESVKDTQEIIILLADTKKELQDIKKENIELIDENNGLNKNLEQEINKNRILNKLNKDFEKEKNNYITKFNESSIEINRLNEQNIDLKSKINDKNNEITMITNNKNNEISELKNQINNLKINIETKNTKLEELNKIIEDLKIDKEDFKYSLREANKSIIEKDNTILKINENQSEFIKKINKLEKDLEEAYKYINILKNENTDI